MVEHSFYNKDYFTKGHELGISAYDENSFLITNDIFERQAEMLTTILKLTGKRVLDVGCALGNLIYYLRRKAVNAYGIDISEWAWEHSHSPFYHHIGSVEDDVYVTELEAVVSFHIFEHLENPEKALKLLHKNMKEGAIFFAVIPSEGHEHDPSGVNLRDRDWWHALLTSLGFIERKDLFDKFLWNKLRQDYKWKVYCYERR